MSKRARQKEIQDIIKISGNITVAEIAEKFRVTTETARKDLVELENLGKVKRFHGGAESFDKKDFHEGVFLDLRLEEYVDFKKDIASRAAEFVKPGESIIIDSGSTMLMLATELMEIPRIRIITSSLPVAMLATEHGISTYIIGGEIFMADYSVGGQWVSNCLNNLNVDIAFIGATAIGNTIGPEVENFTAGNVKQEMMKHSKRKYILADSSKYMASSMFVFGKWEDVDGIVVDKGIPQKFIDSIQSKTQIFIG